MGATPSWTIHTIPVGKTFWGCAGCRFIGDSLADIDQFLTDVGFTRTSDWRSDAGVVVADIDPTSYRAAA